MARIRTIKPEFFRHDGLYDAERASGFPLRIAFAGLWTAADREGRFVWSPRTLKLDCLPHDDVDFSRVLDALATRGFIVKYAVDGKEYGLIPSWHDHQIVNNRESVSKLPAPSNINDLTRAPRVPDACPTGEGNYQGEGKGKERKGKIISDPPDGGNGLVLPGQVIQIGKPDELQVPVTGPPKAYAFIGEVVRLTADNFSKWATAYKYLDLRAELTARDAWLATQSSEIKAKWFVSTANWLNKRNSEVNQKQTGPPPKRVHAW